MDRRNTIQKELVLNAVRRLGNHATADEVYAEISREHPTVSRATVYRNLGGLAEDGIILRVEVPGGADHFDHNVHSHCHIRCLKCGRVYDADMKAVPDLAAEVTDSHGVKILGCDIVFKGICADCSNKQTE